MEVIEAVSETLNTNSTLTRKIALKDFTVHCRLIASNRIVQKCVPQMKIL
jgi:hypothetical protein